MKKFLLLLMLTCTMGIVASAQVKEEKSKVKKTSTVGQKIHNTFSKNKRYKGHKVKHKVEKAKQ